MASGWWACHPHFWAPSSSSSSPGPRAWPLRLPLASAQDFQAIPRAQCLGRPLVIFLVGHQVTLPLYPLLWQLGNPTSLPDRDVTDGLLSLFPLLQSERGPEEEEAPAEVTLRDKGALVKFTLWGKALGVSFSVVLLLA